MLGVLACLSTLAAAPCAFVAGLVRPPLAALTGALLSAAAAALFAAVWLSGGASVLLDVAWLPAPFHARLTFSLDALSGLYATLVTGLGAVVTVYSRGYLPPHLEKHGRPPREEARFVALLLAFMASMVALVLADDLLLLFVALDITAVLSFLLIRFDVERKEARQASLTALFVTAGPSPLFLAGVLLLLHVHGTTSLPELLAEGARASPWAAGLMVAGLLAKSAQVPLHFWLPRAMVAPTPVSAFLHSAAMVAAGVIVLQRLRPLFGGSAVPEALILIGLLSILVGSVSALAREELKLILAGSTVAQYGHVMVLIGLGGDAGSAGAPLYVLAHGLAKAALFLTAGAVTTSTGCSCLSQLGGLFRERRSLALAGLVAALTLAGAPLTVGYFKDEAFFAAGLARGPGFTALLVGVVALAVAYALRFWGRIFLGRRPAELEVHPLSHFQTGAIVALALASLLLGLVPSWLGSIANEAGAFVANRAVDLHLSYSLGGSTLAALSAWLLGAALFLVLRRVEGESTLEAHVTLHRRISPWLFLTRLLRRLSDFGHGIEARDVRDRVGFVLLPTAAIIGLAALFTSEGFEPKVGALGRDDLPTAVALIIAAAAALAVAYMRRHVAVVLLLSFVGFALAFVFSATGSPDVALVAVLIETIFTLLFLAVLSRVPSEELGRAREHASSSARRHLVLAAMTGVGTLFLTWAVLSRPRPPGLTRTYLELTEAAHAKDVVTAILADFRGLDTLGEMTVLLVAAVGVLAMRPRRRPA